MPWMSVNQWKRKFLKKPKKAKGAPAAPDAALDDLHRPAEPIKCPRTPKTK